MTKLRKLSIAVVFVLMLGPSALAGITDYPPAPAPPPSVTATGITDTPPSSAQPVSAPCDPVANIALNLLQTVRSVF